MSLADDFECHLFPNKSGLAKAKTNVYFSDAYADLQRTHPTLALEADAYFKLWKGLYNDQAVAVLFLGLALSRHFKRPFEYALRMVRDPEGAAQLTSVIKGMGAQAHPLGALLVEAKALQGRGSFGLDIVANAESRTVANIPTVWDVDQNRLGDVVRSILDEEIDMSNYAPLSIDEHWSSRWLWCVNGAHSEESESLLHGRTVIPSEVPRRYRRVYAEASKDDPEKNWSGVSYFVPSVKYEHGKERAIFGGDSTTYFAFDRLMRPVEAAWRGYRVVLNPGANGTVGMVDRLRRLQGRGGVHMMMDYDDFNSTHSLASMKTVVRTLCEKVGYVGEEAARLHASISNWWILAGGKHHLVTGTLMSGHRMTSFINSVLNRAYLLIAAPLLARCRSMHVGDDVYVAAPNLETAAAMMADISHSGLAMNPLKQSIGFVSAEFLRVATGKRASYGYYCRALASVISGSWTSSTVLTSRERLTSMVATAWTLCNRAGSQSPADLMVSALVRWTKIARSTASGLLRGDYALGNGPVRPGGFVPLRFSIVEKKKDVTYGELDKVWHSLPRLATSDYLTYWVSPVERDVCESLMISPVRAMVNASYRKSYVGTEAVIESSSLRQERFMADIAFRKSVPVSELLAADELQGALSRYPILMLLRNRLDVGTCRRVLKQLDIPIATDIETQCWGGEARGVVCNSVLPYSDILSLSRRCATCAIHHSYNINA
jgi:hypothetical protein